MVILPFEFGSSSIITPRIALHFNKTFSWFRSLQLVTLQYHCDDRLMIKSFNIAGSNSYENCAVQGIEYRISIQVLTQVLPFQKLFSNVQEWRNNDVELFYLFIYFFQSCRIFMTRIFLVLIFGCCVTFAFSNVTWPLTKTNLASSPVII